MQQTSTAISASPTYVPSKRLRDSGFYGELAARSYVRAQLSAYHMRSNLLIPSRHAGGHREADIVLVGFNGVFVIEVKNWRGTISGQAACRQWSQRLLHRQGNETLTPCGNAVVQTSGATEALRAALRSAGYVDRVQGIVVFAHDKVSLQIEQSPLPVCRLSELASLVLGFPRIQAGRSIAKRVLERLAREPGHSG